MCCDIASCFGRLPFFSYFCSHYDNTERLLQYYILNMDNLRAIDIPDDALYPDSFPCIYPEYFSHISYGILAFFLQSA